MVYPYEHLHEPEKSGDPMTYPPLTTRALRRLPPLPHTDEIRRTGQVKEIHLTATPFRWELLKGVTIDAWGFNNQVPGPLIRATEGDTIQVTVANQLPSNTSVHWHGLHVPNGVDGVAPMTQHHLAPGKEETYSFIANHAGTFFYHSHLDEIQQLDLGVYGPLIIDPQDTTGHPAHDRDYVLVLSGWSVKEDHSKSHSGSANGRTSGAGGKKPSYNYWSVNGKAYPAVPPLKVRQGELVRVRFINASQAVHPMHLHGHDFRLIAMDGHPLDQPLILNTVSVPPGQTVDVDFVADNPGRWLWHCHILHHASNNMQVPGGLTAVVEYEGYEDMLLTH